MICCTACGTPAPDGWKTDDECKVCIQKLRAENESFRKILKVVYDQMDSHDFEGNGTVVAAVACAVGDFNTAANVFGSGVHVSALEFTEMVSPMITNDDHKDIIAGYRGRWIKTNMRVMELHDQIKGSPSLLGRAAKTDTHSIQPLPPISTWAGNW